ncbi:hypothetical protein J3F83DRAFT_646461 [Trichoderma novae-zelandiae]
MLRRTIFNHLHHHLKPSHHLTSRFSTTAKMSSNSQPPSSNDSTSASNNPTSSEQPSAESVPRNALPAPSSSEDIPTLDVSGSGSTVKLDALGPLVVNVDGTMSRIANWAKMADIERENTLRIIGKRNQERLAALRQARGITEGSNDSIGTIGASGNHDTSGKQ